MYGKVTSLCLALAGLMVAASAVASRSAAQAEAACDRACLISMADKYFAAMAAHNSSQAPLAANLRLMEANARTTVAPSGRGAAPAPTPAGDDLWKTVTEAPTGFKIYVPDPVSREIGGIVMLKVSNDPTEIAFRLKVENGRITEADHVIVRITEAAALSNLKSPRPALLATVPTAERLSREDLRSLAYTTYDSIQRSTLAVPLGDDCVRQENGIRMQSAPTGAAKVQLCGPPVETTLISYIDGIPLHRIRIADPETGLVFSLAMNYPSSATGSYSPFRFGAANVNKVQGNKIRAVEAVGFGESQISNARGGQPLKEWSSLTR